MSGSTPPAPAATRAGALAAAVRRLSDAGVADPRLDARLLLEAAAGVDRTALLLEPDRALDGDAAARFEAMVTRRAAREPVHRILGEREFWGLPFRLSPATLEPRPDTETVVAAALDLIADRERAWRILDLGTGSGCILLALLSERPAAFGIGVDRSAGAAATARANAVRLGLDGRAAFLVADWGDGLAGRFDLVVSNPPYIPSGDVAGLEPEVRDHDPATALAAGPDGLSAYRALADRLPGLLAPGGVAVLELGAGQAAAVPDLMSAAGLQILGVRDDLGAVPRALMLRNGGGRVVGPKKKFGTSGSGD
ncbi:MAG TPA: peptide chain release factor N(5)-glutamine methyltransferase [Azospirillaceae bacterium]|nr:peptide chain release factor N(5)-glutamine methyltransferase [Azospirillaceae bacterium]